MQKIRRRLRRGRPAKPLNVRKHPSALRTLGNHRQLVTLANHLNRIGWDDDEIVGKLVTLQRLTSDCRTQFLSTPGHSEWVSAGVTSAPWRFSIVADDSLLSLDETGVPNLSDLSPIEEDHDDRPPSLPAWAREGEGNG